MSAGKATLAEVLTIVGEDCQNRWTPDAIAHFFGSNEEIDIHYLLDAGGPADIPVMDKLWVIERCGMLTAEQKTAVMEQVSQLITDPQSEYLPRYKAVERSIYSYGPICNFLEESTGADRLSFCSQIEAAIIDAIRQVL